MGSWGRLGMACPDGVTQHDRRDASLTLYATHYLGEHDGDTTLKELRTDATRAEHALYNWCGALPLRSKWETVKTAWPGALIVSSLEWRRTHGPVFPCA